MSKQEKDGALSALQELLQRIAADHPNVKTVDMTCGGTGAGRKAQHHPLQEVFDRCIDQAVLGKGDSRASETSWLTERAMPSVESEAPLTKSTRCAAASSGSPTKRW